MNPLRLVENRDPETPCKLSFVVALVAIFVAVGAAILTWINMREAGALRIENQRLRGAFSVMVERSKWSCDLDEGERIICGVKEGTLSRLALAEGDHVVSGRGIASPLGKAPKKKRRRT